MADDHGHEEHGSDQENGRVTSPMQEYTSRKVGVGAAVAAVGIAVAYAVPILL